MDPHTESQVPQGEEVYESPAIFEIGPVADVTLFGGDTSVDLEGLS